MSVISDFANGNIFNGLGSNFQNASSAITPSNVASPSSAGDLRARLSAQPNAITQVYGPEDKDNNILNPIRGTNGMLFPFTPTITYAQQVDYRSLEMVHSNQDFYYYARTPSLKLTINGDFTVQNLHEGKYVLACIHFLRVVSKMFFGTGKTPVAIANRGLPPPVLIFNAYGNYMFNNLRVIVENHSYNLDKNVDYVTIPTAGGIAKLPAFFQISVSLIVQNTPNRMRTEFDLESFRTGALMTGGKSGWI